MQKIKGISVVRGMARGRVRVCPSAANLDALQPGEVLVCEMTTPEYVPAFGKAAAIVTRTGGQLCHAAIVAREFDVVCVTGAQHADTLKDGMVVLVDGNTGIITVCADESEADKESWDTALTKSRDDGLMTSRDRWSDFGKEWA